MRKHDHHPEVFCRICGRMISHHPHLSTCTAPEGPGEQGIVLREGSDPAGSLHWHYENAEDLSHSVNTAAPVEKAPDFTENGKGVLETSDRQKGEAA